MSQSTARATTAAGAGELALAVISPPGLPQLTILGHLEPDDKLRMSLGSICSSMRQASLSWFPDVDVTMKPGKAAAASLAAWLVRHQARLHLSSEALLHLATRPSYDQDDPFEREEAEEYWAGSLAALPSSLMARWRCAQRLDCRRPSPLSQRLPVWSGRLMLRPSWTVAGVGRPLNLLPASPPATCGR